VTGPSTPSTAVSTDALASFVPQFIATRLAADPVAPQGPTSEHFEAALLQCDLSGFTSVAEKLAQLGPAGAEELSRSLSAIFGRLTQTAAEHGGDVFKFAGDALLIVWPVSESEGTALAVRRAAGCGLEMQALLNSDPVAAEYQLAMRAGVGVGDVTAMQLGGVAGRWDLAIVGEPLAQVGEAQTAAPLGKVALSPEALAVLGVGVSEHVEVDYALIGQPPAPLPSPSDLTPAANEALLSYIPRAARVRLAAGQADWIGELRRLSVVFVDVPALAAGPALDAAQKMVFEMQSTLEHFEGSFDKLSVDEKGVKLIGVFGLPPVSHEDDAERAVKAALAMVDGLKRLGVSCSIGISTGRAFCGVLGGADRREYTVIGDMVNLSARLMQSAQGGILCDEETYRASQTRMAFRASRPIVIKGKADPVTAYRPTGEHADAVLVPQAGPDPTSEMVGRSVESDELNSMLAALVDGHSEILVIEGEAGIGKSRVVEHLLGEADALGLRILFGAGDAIESTSPYRAWGPILGQLLGFDAIPDDREAQRNRVIDTLTGDDELAQLSPLVNAVLSLGIPDTEFTDSMDAEVRADNLQLIVTHILQSAADDGPLLLVFDDAQWIDPSSWQLARQVLRRVQPLATVMAMRPFGNVAPTEYQAFVRASSPRQMILGPLPSADIASLVCQTLGIDDLSHDVMDLLQDKAEGHPLFGKELAYYLRNEGLVVTVPSSVPGRLPSGQLAPGASLDEVAFPDSVQVVVTTRIDRLDAEQQLILKVASVIGRVFDVELLKEILPVETTQARFEADLERLVESELIAAANPMPDATYAFKHAIIQEVAYGLLLFADRRELHRSVAQWHEDTYGAESERYVPVLAHHWTMAEVEEKAIKYQALAGEQALANFANEEAITYISKALDLADSAGYEVDRTVRARWQLHMGEAQVHWSRYVEGRRHLEQGLALLEHPVPQTTSSVARMGYLASALIKQWRTRIFGRRRLVDDPEERTGLLLASRSYTRLVEAAFLSGDQWLALYSSFHALNLAESTGPSPELAEGYAPVGVIYGAIPWRSEATRYLDRALDTARRTESPSALGYTLLAYGAYAVGAADWKTALSMSEELVDLGHSVGARKRLNDGLQLLTSVRYSQGDFAGCLEAADELITSASRGNDPRFGAYGRFARAYGTLYLGRLDESLALLGEIPDLLGAQSETTDRMLELMHFALLGAAYLRLGRGAEAMDAALDAQVRQAGAPLDLGYTLPGYALTAEVLLGLWESGHPDPRLRDSAHQACHSLRRFARLYGAGRPYSSLCQGTLASIVGKPAKAARHWNASIAGAELLGMPFVAGRAHLELAKHLPQDLPEQKEHAAAAKRIFEDLGTPAEVEQSGLTS